MDRVFSVDDISDQFWSPPQVAPAEEESSSISASKMMNRCASEWAFQRFLQEAVAPESSPPSSSKPTDVVEIKSFTTASFAAGPSPNVPIDSDEYQAFLKSRLNLACAAVCNLTRVGKVN